MNGLMLFFWLGGACALFLVAMAPAGGSSERPAVLPLMLHSVAWPITLVVGYLTLLRRGGDASPR